MPGEKEDASFEFVRNLSHVFLDGELGQTTLEGSELGKSSAHITEFLNDIKTTQGDPLDQFITQLANASISSKTATGLAGMSNTFKHLIEINDQLIAKAKAIQKEYKGVEEEKFKQYASDISKLTLDKFAKEQDIFIPGGWKGSPGHQMIYRLTREKNRILLRVYNTGAGVQHHGSVPRASGKKGVYPVMAFELNSQISQLKLQKILNELYRLQLLPPADLKKFRFSENNVYENVLLALPAWLDQDIKILTPDELNIKPILGQRSGTCVFKSITHIIREHFDDKEKYRLFLLAYRLYLLKKAFSKDIAEKAQEIFPDYHKMLERALANTIRMLDKDLKPKVNTWNIQPRDISAIESQLDQWQNQINSSPTMPLNRIRYFNECDTTKLELGSSYFTLPASTVKNSAKPPAEAAEPNWEQLSFLQTIDVLAKTDSVEPSMIENFCLRFSDTNKTLIPDDEKVHPKELLWKMGRVLSLYNSKRRDITQRNPVVYLSLTMMMDRILKGPHIQYQQRSLPLHAYVATHTIAPLLEKIKTNPFLATKDPRLDYLTQKVQDYFNVDQRLMSPDLPKEITHEERETIYLNFYCNLIEQAPKQEIEAIQKMWDDVDSKNLDIYNASCKLLSEKKAYMYSFLSRVESKEVEKIAPSLAKIFSQVIVIERFYEDCLTPIANTNTNSSTKTSLHSNYFLQMKIANKKAQMDHPLNYDNSIFLKSDLYSKYFEFKDTAVNNALTMHYDRNGFDSHELSLRTPGTTFSTNVYDNQDQPRGRYKKLKSRSEAARREGLLHQLRNSPSNMIPALLTELLQQPTWLANKEYQQFIELSLFQPGVLLTEFKKNANFLELMTKVIEKNRHNNDPSHPDASDWFMLKMAAAIANYGFNALEHGYITLSDAAQLSMQHWQKTLLQAIELRLNENITIQQQRELYSLKLNTLANQSPVSFAELASTYLIMSLLPLDKSKTSVLQQEADEALLDACKAKLDTLIQPNSKAMADIVKSILPLLKKLDPNNPIWKASWECDSLNNLSHEIVFKDENNNTLSINLIKRELKYNQDQLAYIPLFLQLTPEYQTIIGNTLQLATKTRVNALNRDCDSYRWQDKDTEFEFIVLQSDNNTPTFRLNKKIGTEWYTLTAATNEVRKAMNYSSTAFRSDSINPLFLQSHYRFWCKDRHDYVIEDTNTGKIVYQAFTNTLKRNEEPSGNVIYNNTVKTKKYKIPSILNRLEADEFIEQIERDDNTTCWHLPRYHLTIEEDKEHNGYRTTDGQYRLRYPTVKDDVFGSGLMFESITDKNKVFLAIPLQRYYQPEIKDEEEKESGAHYVWTHDFHNQLAKGSMGSNDQFRGWNFNGSERMIHYTLKDGHIDPTIASYADKVYLAYLYLAQDQAEKAFEILTSTKFQPTPDVVERLWWIITQLPAAADDQIENPRITAVRMQALYILLELKEQTPHFIDSLKPIANANAVSATDIAHNNQRGQLIEFIKALPQKVRQHYSQYDNLRNNIPIALKLTKTTEESLLSFCHNEFLKLKPGSIYTKDGQVELKQHTLEELGTRYYEHFPAEDAKKSVSHYASTNMAKITYVITPDTWTRGINAFQKDYKIPAENKNELTDNVALAALSPWITATTLVNCLPLYYEIAQKGTAQQKAEIQKACIGIISWLYSVSEKQIKEKTLLTNIAEILLFITTYPNQFPESFKQFMTKKDGTISIDLDFFAKKSEEAATLTTLPTIKIPIYRYVQQQIPHHISVRSPLESKEEKEIKASGVTSTFKIRDPLTLSIFASVKADLEAKQVTFDKLRQTILTKLSDLETKPMDLKEQDNYLNQLDNELLHAQNALHQEQLAIYKKYRQQCINETDKLTEARDLLKLDQKDLSHKIEKILAKRKRPIIKELGKQYRSPTIKTLVKNSAIATIEDYLKMGIADNEIPILQEHIKEYMALHDAERRLELLIHEMQKEKKNNSEPSLNIITSLISKNEASHKYDALFQYIEKLALRPSQASMLKLLVSSDKPELLTSQVLQLIMGGGKTKVIMPILLNMLADGQSLPIAIFPDMSLNTNFNDISATSSKVFQQESFLFQFSRDSASEPSDFQYIYERFELAIRNKQYMVCSAASIESLQLKYIELLYYRNPPNTPLSPEALTKNNEQLKWLEKSLVLLNKRSKAVVDEAHQLLSIRKELNYSIGESKQIDPNITSNAIKLFSWLNSVKIPEGLISSDQMTFSYLLKNPNLIANKAQVDNLMNFYITKLTDPASQPEWLQELFVGNLTIKDLRKYLLSAESDSEMQRFEKEVYKKLDSFPEIKAKWTLLREETKTLLPQSLQMKLHENYGPNIGNLTYPFAIPYRANNTPTPYVFANFLEIINFTSQMLYCDGITKQSFIELLRAWKRSAELQRQEDNTEITKEEILFNKVFDQSGHTLQTLDLDDANLMEKLHQQHKKNEALVETALKDILNRIAIDKNILRCDTMNLADIFTHVFAFSGTPSNYRTFHPKIKMAQASSLLIESQLIHYLKQKGTNITLSKGNTKDTDKNADLSIQQAFSADPNVCALIECGGHLRGLNNKDTAIKLANNPELVKNKRFILYYEEDALYAWDISQKTAIKLSSTDPDVIKNELNGCTPEERLTLYDQEHTTGSDIKQMPTGIGVVTVDLKTGISNFLQAVARMREFNQSQEIIIVLAPGMDNILRAASPLDALIDLMRNNQRLQLEVDHFHAAVKSIRNGYRQDILQRLYTQNNPNKRDHLFNNAKEFFVEDQTDNVLKIYANKSYKQDTDKIMQQVSKDQHVKWQTAVSNLPRQDIAPAEKSLKEDCDKICDLALLNCEKQQVYPLPQFGKQAQAQTQKQTQTQTQTQKQTQTQQESEYLSETVAIKPFELEWIQTIATQPKKALSILKKHALVKSLIPDKMTLLNFSSAIHLSNDFIQQTQEEKSSNLFKITHNSLATVLFVWDYESNRLVAFMLSPEEFEAFNRLLTSSQFAATEQELKTFCWLSTLSGEATTPLPTFSEKQHKQEIFQETIQKQKEALLEQINYLNGRADHIVSNGHVAWLKENTQEKMQFFDKNIKPALGVPQDTIRRLENCLYSLEQKHIDYWTDPNTSQAERLLWKEQLPRPLIRRMDKIIPYLESIQATGCIKQQPLLLEDLVKSGMNSNDAELLVAFNQAIIKQPNYTGSAEYILKNPKARLPALLDACFENMPNNVKRAELVASRIATINPEMQWLTRFAFTLRSLRVFNEKDDVTVMREIAQFLFQKDIFKTVDYSDLYLTDKFRLFKRFWLANMRDEVTAKAILRNETFCSIAALLPDQQLSDTTLIQDLLSKTPDELSHLLRRLKFLEHNHALQPWHIERALSDPLSGEALEVLRDYQITQVEQLHGVLQKNFYSKWIINIHNAGNNLPRELTARLLNQSEEMLRAINTSIEYLTLSHIPMTERIALKLAQIPMTEQIALNLMTPQFNTSLIILNRSEVRDAQIIALLNKQPAVPILLNKELLDHLIQTKQFGIVSHAIKFESESTIGQFIASGILNRPDSNNVVLLRQLIAADPDFMNYLLNRAPIDLLLEQIQKHQWLKNNMIDFSQSPEAYLTLLDRAPLFAIKHIAKINPALLESKNRHETFITKPKECIEASGDKQQLAHDFLNFLESHVPDIIDKRDSTLDEKSLPLQTGATKEWLSIIDEAIDQLNKIAKSKKPDITPFEFRHRSDRLRILKIRCLLKTPKQTPRSALALLNDIDNYKNCRYRDLNDLVKVIHQHRLEKDLEPFLSEHTIQRNVQLTQTINNEIIPAITQTKSRLFASGHARQDDIYARLITQFHKPLLKKLSLYLGLQNNDFTPAVKNKILSELSMPESEAKTLLMADISWELKASNPNCHWNDFDKMIIPKINEIIHAKQTFIAQPETLKAMMLSVTVDLEAFMASSDKQHEAIKVQPYATK